MKEKVESKYYYKFTQHLRKRYRERILHPKKKRISIPEMDKIIADELYTSTENKSVWNNTGFISYIFDVYGTNDYHFMMSDDTIFVCIKENDINNVITCYPRRDSHIKHFDKANKY